MSDWKPILRNFLTHGGRVLVEPSGAVTESAGVRCFVGGDTPETDAAIAAHREYFAKLDPALRARTKRAALLLGRQTENGWRVLEA